jgi:hypothetical protein
VAGTKSDYLENKMLDHVLGGPDYTRPATVYMGLFTVAPSDSGGGTEASTGVWTNYARAAVTNNATNFPAASGGLKSNGTVISFGTASISGTAPTIVGFGIYDASTAGNLLYWASFTGQVVSNGSPISIQIGDLQITDD